MSEVTIQVTSIGKKVNTFSVEMIKEENRFNVYSNSPGEFYWLVHGKRHEIDVEPDVEKTVVAGQGPYKWIVN